MGIKLMAIGGYSEVGKNMTALDIDGEIIIFDMGLYLPAIVGFEDEQENFSEEDLVNIGAIPNDRELAKNAHKVKAIILGHAHLDHIGAVTYLSKKYKNASIIGTPYTINVLMRIAKDKGRKIHNKVKTLNVGSSLKISKNVTVEFFNVTHSTINCALIVLHTNYGDVVYSLDFKLDNNPVIGKKMDYEKLKKLNVNTLILDSLYSREEGKTPSEKVAHEMLRDVLLGVKNEKNAIVITTFSSHIARLKSIIEQGKLLKRKIVFLGRSLNRYVRAAEDTKFVKFSDKVEIVGYSSKVRKKLNQIMEEGVEKYIIVCTGNQAEPKSVLTKMANGEFKFKFNKGDIVVFSCRTIPVEENIKNREKLENKLTHLGCRLFKNVHTSGHAYKEDERDLINLLKPKKIIPGHGGKNITSPAGELGKEIGYTLGKNIFILKDGDILEL